MYTAEQFLAWLKQQPPEDEYDYQSPLNCAFAQFLKAQGHLRPDVGLYYYKTAWDQPRINLDPHIVKAFKCSSEHAEVNDIDEQFMTFGDVAEELEALIG